MSKKNNKTAFQYIKTDSIIYGLQDSYKLTSSQYSKLYMFYVTNSINPQSGKLMTLKSYGWKNENSENQQDNNIKKKLKSIIKFSDKSKFEFPKKEVSKSFQKLDLFNVIDLSKEQEERFSCIGSGTQIKLLLKHIRHCFAHGKYVLFENVNSREKMIAMQDNDTHNVTARIVLKLSTLLGIIKIIDKNNRLANEFDDDEGEV